MLSYFKVHVKEIEGGIEVKIELVINDVITGIKEPGVEHFRTIFCQIETFGRNVCLIYDAYFVRDFQYNPFRGLIFLSAPSQL